MTNDPYIDALETDRVTLHLLAQLVCEAHTHTGGMHDAAYYDRLYEVAYNALPAETRAQFLHPSTFERATHTNLQPGMYQVDFDGKRNAHFEPSIDGAFCNCNLPGIDADRPDICPTCGRPHRL